MSSFFDFFGSGHPFGHGHPGMRDEDEGPVDTTSHYETLGVEKDCSDADIKKAYRKLARKLHPDRHPNEREKYLELFQKLQSAHDVLGNPVKRAAYDKGGDKAAKIAQERSERNARRGQHTTSGGIKKSPPIRRAMGVSLEDVYKGVTKKMDIERHVEGSSTEKCARCGGQGVISITQMMGPVMFKKRANCSSCAGRGYKLETQRVTIDVNIPIGGRNKENVTVSNEGHRYPSHAPGDVIVQLRLKNHDVFTRKGADLGMSHELTLREALLGYKLRVEHVSGHTLVIENAIPGETVQPGQLKQIMGYGMPQRGSPHVKGHLYIAMSVKLPLSRSLKANAVNQLREILPDLPPSPSDGEGAGESGDEKKSESTNNQSSSSSSSSNSSKKKGGPQGKKKKWKKGKGKRGKGGSNTPMDEDNSNAGGGDDDGSEAIITVSARTMAEENLRPTPAAARGSEYDDDEDGAQSVQCHQM